MNYNTSSKYFGKKCTSSESTSCGYELTEWFNCAI